MSLSRRRFLLILPFCAAASARAETKNVAAPSVQLATVGIPVMRDNRLVNYLFLSIRVNLTGKANEAKLRDMEPYFRDAIVRAASKTSFAQADNEDVLDAPRFKAEHPVTKLEGDRDIFGDGSIVILSTPGHTPGHQSLLVKLPKTGEVILSGDAVHFRSNWENRGVPANNFSKEETLASMQKIADRLARDHAQLWINHDKAQRDTLKMSPEFYE